MIDGRSRDMGSGTVSKLNDIGMARVAAEEERACLKDSLDPLDKYVKKQEEEKAVRSTQIIFGNILDEFFVSKD